MVDQDVLTDESDRSLEGLMLYNTCLFSKQKYEATILLWVKAVYNCDNIELSHQ